MEAVSKYIAKTIKKVPPLLIWYVILSLAIGFIVFIIFYLYFKCRRLMQNLKLTEGTIQERAEEYKKSTIDLETRILEESSRRKQKDLILIQHSKHAALGEIISSTDQEWLKPLNSLSLLVQDVKDAREFGEIDDMYIDRFIMESMSQIKLLSRKVQDIRRFYQNNPEKNHFSVGDSIEEALTLLFSTLLTHKIHVDFEYRGQPIGYGYSNEFSHVIFRILTHVRDAFLDQGIVKNRKVSITLNETVEKVTVDILVHAGNMDLTHFQTVFDPSFATRSHGIHLGLYIAKISLENMDGQISVENKSEGIGILLALPKVNMRHTPKLVTI